MCGGRAVSNWGSASSCLSPQMHLSQGNPVNATLLLEPDSSNIQLWFCFGIPPPLLIWQRRRGREGGELVCNVCSPQKLQRVGDEAGDGDKGGGRAILKQLIRSMASKPLMCPSTPRGWIQMLKVIYGQGAEEATNRSSPPPACWGLTHTTSPCLCAFHFACHVTVPIWFCPFI